MSKILLRLWLNNQRLMYIIICMYIEQMQEVYYELECKLWCREKYWQTEADVGLLQHPRWSAL